MHWISTPGSMSKIRHVLVLNSDCPLENARPSIRLSENIGKDHILSNKMVEYLPQSTIEKSFTNMQNKSNYCEDTLGIKCNSNHGPTLTAKDSDTINAFEFSSLSQQPLEQMKIKSSSTSVSIDSKHTNGAIIASSISDKGLMSNERRIQTKFSIDSDEIHSHDDNNSSNQCARINICQSKKGSRETFEGRVQIHNHPPCSSKKCQINNMSLTCTFGSTNNQFIETAKELFNRQHEMTQSISWSHTHKFPQKFNDEQKEIIQLDPIESCSNSLLLSMSIPFDDTTTLIHPQSSSLHHLRKSHDKANDITQSKRVIIAQNSRTQNSCHSTVMNTDVTDFAYDRFTIFTLTGVHTISPFKTINSFQLPEVKYANQYHVGLIHNSPLQAVSSTNCCTQNLTPAPVPENPLDDECESSSLLEKELAWLVEETSFILPSSLMMKIESSKCNSLILLSFAWNHGSLQIREIIMDTFPAEAAVFSRKINSDSLSMEAPYTVLVDAHLLLLHSLQTLRKDRSQNNNFLFKNLKRYDLDYSKVSPSIEVLDRLDKKFKHLREEAHAGLLLGYRRSDSIRSLLDCISRCRWNEALGEQGDFNDKVKNDPYLKLSLRRQGLREVSQKRRSNHDKYNNISSSEMENTPLTKPTELTNIEEEIAWLCEESLILLPRISIISKQQNSVPQSEVKVSAGLITEAAEVDWSYVLKYACDPLKKLLELIGMHHAGEFQVNTMKRPARILQRIVRYHDRYIRAAFLKRQHEIASLLISGYRREQTVHVLPSNDVLSQTGFLDILTLRLFRRKQQNQFDNIASSKDLRSACNQRIGQNNGLYKSHKRKATANASSHHEITEKCEIQRSCNASVLTVEEEEIAWLREEYSFHYDGLKGYDWEYIEQHSSSHLLKVMFDKGVLFSVFPTVPGVSKLLKLVRLDNKRIHTAFERKRVDIRYAMERLGCCRDLQQELPSITEAPDSFLTIPVHQNGANVIEIEYPLFPSHSKKM